jgi:hypothetical protein
VAVSPGFGEYQGATTTAARALLFGRRATPAIADWGSARRCAVCSCWSSPAQARIGPSLVPASWRSSSAVVSKATPSQLARPRPGHALRRHSDSPARARTKALAPSRGRHARIWTKEHSSATARSSSARACGRSPTAHERPSSETNALRWKRASISPSSSTGIDVVRVIPQLHRPDASRAAWLPLALGIELQPDHSGRALIGALHLPSGGVNLRSLEASAGQQRDRELHSAVAEMHRKR